MADNYQNLSFQFTKVKANEGGEIKTINVGPVPEGNYLINLSLDPNRKWKLSKNGESELCHGIEELGPFYPEWGTLRARLDIGPGPNTKGRDFFYFHNSTKGYSHGCTETQDELFRLLLQFRDIGTSIIKVKAYYGTKNKSKNGELRKIKVLCIFLTLHYFIILQSYAQSSNCAHLKIINNIKRKDFSPGDTVRICFKNIGSVQLKYRLETAMLIKNDWYYSDFYTRYFNRTISYKKLSSILKSKFPISAPQNYSIPSYDLNANEVRCFFFVVDKTETNKTLIRLRIHILDADQNCDLISFEPSYFFKIR